MRFKDESISDVLQVLAGILNLGNVTFIAGNGAQINEKFGTFCINVAFLICNKRCFKSHPQKKGVLTPWNVLKTSCKFR